MWSFVTIASVTSGCFDPEPPRPNPCAKDLYVFEVEGNRVRLEEIAIRKARFFHEEKPHALPNILDGSRIRRIDRRHRAGVGAIAVLLPLVLTPDRGEERHDKLLFHQLCAMHDDDLRHRRLVLPKPRLQRGAQFGADAPPPPLSMTLQASAGAEKQVRWQIKSPGGAAGAS
jgi:hypothetical protein